MNAFYNVIIIVQVLSALAIIGLVLLQHGKGADMGAAFGSGASGSLFGASGSSNFMSKSTAVAAVIFFGATLALSSMATHRSSSTGGGVLENYKAAPAAPAPAKPADAIPGAAPAAPANGVPAPVAAPATAPAASAPAAPAAPAASAAASAPAQQK
jgi:preprotein translocase subunit SecG